MLDKYLELYQAGAQAIIFVGNDSDAIKLVKAEISLPAAQRIPIISHWGVTGGDFSGMAGHILQDVDFSVVQTYSFIGKQDAAAQRVLASANRLFNVADARRLDSPVGVAHAYDLTHILAKAINLAGVIDRAKIRDALEQVKGYAGLIKTYKQPFTAERHDALILDDVFMAKYAVDGAIEPLPMMSSRRK